MQTTKPDPTGSRAMEVIAAVGLATSLGLMTYAAQRRKAVETREAAVSTQNTQGANTPTLSAPQPTGAPPTENTHQYDLLRSLRVEVQSLQSLLADVRAGLISLDNAKASLRHLACRGEDLMQRIEAIGGRPSTSDANRSRRSKEGKKHAPWQRLIGARQADQQPDPVVPLIEWASIYYIRDRWERIIASPLVDPILKDAQSNASPKPEEHVHYLTLLDTHCREIVFECGFWTIPDTLNGWLAQARPSYAIPFHAVFEDELPVQEDRVKMLSFLAISPKEIQNGLIDVPSGLIYRYNRRLPVRVGTLLLLGLAFLAFTWLVVNIGKPESGLLHVGGLHLHIGPFDRQIGPYSFLRVSAGNWPFKETQETLIIGWVAVLAGTIVHVAVATAKRLQTQATVPPVIAVADFLPRINAFFGQILLKLFLALFAFLGLALSTKDVNYLNFFLAGYTLDSVVELFGATLEQRAGSQVAALKQQLNGAAGKAS